MFSMLSIYLDGSDFSRYLHAGLTPELAEVFQDMHSYTIMVDLYSRGIMRNPSMCVMADRRNSIQFRLLSLPSAKELGGDHFQGRDVYESCRIAAIIFSLLIIFPLPPVNAPLQLLARSLSHVLAASDLHENWKSAPELLLWILMLGAVASGNEKWWFITIAHRTGIAAEIRGGRSLKQVLESVMWPNFDCGVDSEALWNEVMGSSENTTQLRESSECRLHTQSLI
jgi:hypothetical protein